ncbi:TPA: hypothetical protein ACJJYX_004314 [Enterobacter cloacae]
MHKVIPYILLGLIGGVLGSAYFIVDMLKQELKTGTVAMGRRVYKVVEVKEFKRNG